MSTQVVQWVSRELSRLLGVEAPQDIAEYILAIESRKDLEEYVSELLDPSNPRQRRFIQELLQKWRPPRQLSVPVGAQVYIKNQEEELFPSKEKGKNKKKPRKQQELISLMPQPEPESQPHTNGALPLKEIPYGPAERGLKKKKDKFVPLFNEEGAMAGTAAKLPGRHPCECQASKHALVANCLTCGRVVCQQEGSGPCLFCGQLVCSAEEREILDRGSKKSDRLRQQLMGGAAAPIAPARMQQINEGFEKARQHKDKLLEYDRTSVKRTQVLDDESDYFTTEGNSWLSDHERQKLKQRQEQLHQARHASRLDRKFTLDFAGRRVVQDEALTDVYDVNDDVVQEVHYGKKKSETTGFQLQSNEFFDLSIINPNVEEPPKFIPSQASQKGKSSFPSEEESVPEKKRGLRLQDSQLQEMGDDGVCMSMHQPWASLLVSGIKKHEGRSWYTSHRGRLWIAATAKAPAPEETAEVEQQYRYHYKSDLVFPEAYPTGCLLGCVSVTNCLSQEDYQQQFPGGESGSPYVFICENPQELILKQPIKGKHKIYKLDTKVHQSAKKGLRTPAPFMNS